MVIFALIIGLINLYKWYKLRENPLDWKLKHPIHILYEKTTSKLQK